jgi:hypothetical protein
MRVEVRIPVRLVLGPSALRGSGLEDLEKQIAEQVQKTWVAAQREVAEDGFAGTPRAQVTGFEWQGPGRRALDEPERRQVEKRLRAAIRAASATVLAAPPTRAWRLHPPFEFRARFDRFFEIVKPWWYTGYQHDLEARTGEHFTDSVKAVAWVVDVTRTVSAVELRDALAAERMPFVGRGPYLLFRDRRTGRRVRALDPGHLAGLPSLPTDEPVFRRDQRLEEVFLPPGMRLQFIAAQEPAASSIPLADFAPAFDVEVPFVDLLTSAMPDFAALQKAYGQTHEQNFLKLYDQWAVPVRVQPFRMVRSAFRDIVKRIVVEHAKRDAEDAQTFGRLVHFANDDLEQQLPKAVAESITRWANQDAATSPLPPRKTPVAGGPDWQAGDRGVLATPVFTDIRGRLLAARNVEALRKEAATLAHIVLEMSDGFLSGPDRLNALIKFLLDWRFERPKAMMEVLFAELDRLHAFTALFNLLSDHYSLYGWMRMAVIGNVTGTSFEQRPEVQRMVAWMNAVRLEVMSQITWDPATNELVFVHSGRRLKPSGEHNPDPNAGVIGHVESYFTSKGVVSRPTKATLDKLAEPTRRKIQELMLGMLCRAGETRTKEQLLAEAVEAAAKELKLDPDKDFERVKVYFSLRIIAIDQHTEHGLRVLSITAQPVQKFADGDWEDTGPRKGLMTLAELDAEMVSIHVDHEMRALTAFLIIEALLLTGGYIVFSGGLLGAVELVIAISIRELIYVLTTSAADRDLEGYLTQAFYGAIDVIGFRLGARAGTSLAGKFVTEEALKSAATKWLVYATKGLASATALGLTQVVEKFADDLIHLSSCRRWSSPMDYLKEFGTGFAVGLTFEFAVVPALSVAGRGLVRALARSKMGSLEVAELLAKEMRAADIEDAAAQGMKNLEEALTNTVKPEKLGLVQEFMQALRQQWKEVVEHARAVQEPKGLIAKMRSEWTTRAIKDLFEARKVVLGPDAQRTLEILIRTTSRDEVTKVVEGVMRSDRLRLFLDTKPRLATELLTRAFRGTPDELEAFLVRLERMPKAEANRVLEALVRIGVDDAGQVVLNSGKTVEELLELIGKDSAAAKPLGAYSKQVIGKKFQDLTRRDLVNSATWQDKLFKEATDLRDRQNLLKDQILSDVNRGGKGKSILKRDDFKEFVTGIEQKMERNSYVKVSQMDDIVRGRFDMPDREGVERVYKALDDQKMYKVKEITEPRTVKGDPDVFRYPRYHVILEDAKTGMTHEWQVGTRATTRLYEKEGITIPKALEEAAQRLKKEFHADLHDIEFDVFQRIVKDHPAVAVKYPELPRFIRDVAEASNKSFAGEAFTDLERTIAELHGRATEILKKIVDQEGGEWVAKLFH